MERLVIINYNTREVDIYPVEPDSKPDIDEILEKLDYTHKVCQYIHITGNITIHNEILK